MGLDCIEITDQYKSVHMTGLILPCGTAQWSLLVTSDRKGGDNLRQLLLDVTPKRGGRKNTAYATAHEHVWSGLAWLYCCVVLCCVVCWVTEIDAVKSN